MRQTFVVLLLIVLASSGHGQNPSASGTNPGIPSGRIVNGTSVSIAKYPFIVVLRLYDASACGASVITVKHALSAAHCLETRPLPEAVTLHGGSTDWRFGGVIFPIISYVIHPNYNTDTFDNDASVITIKDTFAGKQNIAVIPLQETEIAFTSTSPTRCYALGWGYTNGVTMTMPNNLQYVRLYLTSYAACAGVWAPTRITDQMICAQFAYADMCYGDSGGPLVCNGKLTGIVSFGAERCTGQYPSVFAKVSSTSILSFIKSNTKL